MLSALLYLRFTSARNWLLSRLRRLREPKYLFGAIVGIAYFYFFFFRGLTGPAPLLVDGPGEYPTHLTSAALSAEWLPPIVALGGMALLIILVLMWVVPTGPATLGFTEAEIAFLFPAPITRRALVHFRLLTAQFRSLLGAAVMRLLSNRWTVLGGNPLTHAVGWWFIFSALSLHHNAAGFTLTRLADRGLRTSWRRILVLGALVTVIGATVTRMRTSLPTAAAGGEVLAAAVLEWMVELAATAPLSWLLLPLQLVLAPFLALDTPAFLHAVPPALAVLTLHYLWVVRAAVSFEDATIEHAEKRAARLAAWRAGDRRLTGGPAKNRRGPFRLSSTGRPEVAFLWKNLLSTWPYFTVRAFAIAAFVIAASCTWLAAQPALHALLPAISTFAMVFAIYTLIVGPQFARQDIRTDLMNTDLLKTYPLAGWQVVLGELLTPAAILTGVLWLTLLAVALTFQPAVVSTGPLSPSLRVSAALAFAAITPAIVMLQLLVPNAAALLFPGWLQASRGRGGGPEVVGQRMIYFFAQLLTMVLALLPPVVVGASAFFLLQWLIGLVAAVLIAAALVLTLLLIEVACGVWWLGGRFEKLDLSSDLRP